MDANALRRARELRGLSANALAAKLNVSQAIIWQIESGRTLASADITRRIAAALDVPVEFLVRPPRLLGEGSLGLFRAFTSKLNKSEEITAKRVPGVILEFVERLSEGLVRPDAQAIRAFGDSPELVAERARALLGYSPMEPIGNLTRRLEKLGATVVKGVLKEDAAFGYSTWANERTPRPFIVINHLQTPYRARWTLGHELGHVFLGHEYAALPADIAEDEADRFAGALLVPTDMFTEDIQGGTSLSAYSFLKRRYGVSIKALVRRSHEMGLIDHAKYTSLNVQISQKQWRKKEPGDDVAEYEEPALVKQLIAEKFPDTPPHDIPSKLGLPHDVVYPSMLTTKEFKEVRKLQEMLSYT